MSKPEKVEMNSFYYYANEYRKHLTDEDEIEKINMTQIFLDELETHIKEGEIIIIQINGKTRLGKSTLGIALGHNHVYELLKKYRQQNKNNRFNINNICRDQQEYSKKMRNPELRNNILVIDEWNALEKTGENTTAEESLLAVYSDVQAGRYIHTIACSPKETIDRNCDIILNVISINKHNKTTRCKLYYRFYEAGEDHQQLLGYCEFYVGNIIENWDKEAKKLFYNNKRTKTQEKRLEELRKKDFYVEYMIKKYEKMDLINKEGIFKPRILDYAEVILKVINRLKPLCRMTNLINQDIIRNYIKMEFKNAKIPTSIIGERLATDEASGVIDLYKACYKLETTINKAIEKGNDTTKTRELLKEVLNAIEIQTQEYKRYAEIQRKYNTNTSEGEKQ